MDEPYMLWEALEMLQSHFKSINFETLDKTISTFEVISSKFYLQYLMPVYRYRSFSKF